MRADYRLSFLLSFIIALLKLVLLKLDMPYGACERLAI
jgi:hypothetical protein